MPRNLHPAWLSLGFWASSPALWEETPIPVSITTRASIRKVQILRIPAGIRDFSLTTDYLLCVMFICHILPLFPESTGKTEKAQEDRKSFLYCTISFFSSLCLCLSFCFCPSLSTSAPLFADWLRKGREANLENKVQCPELRFLRITAPGENVTAFVGGAQAWAIMG